MRWSTSVTRHPTSSATWPSIQRVYHPRITKPLRLVRMAITFSEGSLRHLGISVRHRGRSRGAVGDPGARVTSSGHPCRHSGWRRRAKPVLRASCVGSNRSSSPVTEYLTHDLALPRVGHRACRARVQRRTARQGNSKLSAYQREAFVCPAARARALGQRRPRVHSKSCLPWWSSVRADGHGVQIGSSIIRPSSEVPELGQRCVNRVTSRADGADPSRRPNFPDHRSDRRGARQRFDAAPGRGRQAAAGAHMAPASCPFERASRCVYGRRDPSPWPQCRPRRSVTSGVSSTPTTKII